MQKTLTTDWRLHIFSPDDSLPLQPDYFWLIKRGAVKTLTWNEDGTMVTLGYWGPTDVIGKPLSELDPYEITCLTEVEASFIPLVEWNWLSDGIRRYIQQTEELFFIIRSYRVAERLLKILVWLGKKFGRRVEQGVLIDLRLTHQDLAELAATSRVTVTRLLKEFEEEGIINRPRRHFIVLGKTTNS